MSRTAAASAGRVPQVRVPLLMVTMSQYALEIMLPKHTTSSLFAGQNREKRV